MILAARDVDRRRIQILNALSPAEMFLVLAHEDAHCLLHRADYRPASRDTRELEAEAVAFVVGEAVALEARQSSPDICISTTAP